MKPRTIYIEEDGQDISVFGLVFSSILLGCFGVLNFLLALGLVDGILSKNIPAIIITLIISGLMFWFITKGIYKTVRHYYAHVQNQVSYAVRRRYK